MGEIFSTYTVIGESMCASLNNKMYRAVFGHFVPLRTFLVVNSRLYLYFAEKKKNSERKPPFCLYALLIKSSLLEEITEHV